MNELELLFSHSVGSDYMQPHGLQYVRPPCSNSCPLSQWCPPTISSSVAPFSSCPQSFPASGSFPMSWLFASGSQSIGALASVLSLNIHDWFPLGLTDLNFLQYKGISRVFSSTTVWKHQFLVLTLSTVQLSPLYITTGKTIVFKIWTLLAKWWLYF